MLLETVYTSESHSTHPIATAIQDYIGQPETDIILEKVSEIPGRGMLGIVDGKTWLVGNFTLLDQYNISYEIDPNSMVETVIAIAYNQKFAGYLTIADEIKEEAPKAIQASVLVLGAGGLATM